MARVVRTVTELTDDISGGDAEETISFALDGTSYEIDLNAENAEALRDALAPYVGHARKATREGRRSSGGGGGRRAAAAGSNGNVSDIRSWARENGHKVSERGRISADILAAYEQAH